MVTHAQQDWQEKTEQNMEALLKCKHETPCAWTNALVWVVASLLVLTVGAIGWAAGSLKDVERQQIEDRLLLREVSTDIRYMRADIEAIKNTLSKDTKADISDPTADRTVWLSPSVWPVK